MLKDILLAFIPIFVAVDVIGILPVYVSLTRGIEKKERLKIIIQSLVTALCLAVGFIFLGKVIFKTLGITIGDFMIAGGAILFCIAIMDLLNPGKKRRMPIQDLGVVPLGTPLVVGPAVLTTSLIIISEYGLGPTLVSIFLNITLVGVVLVLSDGIMYFLGNAGARALSKITSLLLAAISVMMIRKGILQILG